VKVLVTGGRGLLGSAITEQKSHEIVSISRDDVDLLDFGATVSLFAEEKPDAVIHAAALVGGIGGNLMKSGEYFSGNTTVNLNVLEAARVAGVSNLVSFMSTCVFPDKANYPLTVDQLHLGPPHPSNFGYAYSKRMLDIQTRAYNQQWGLNYKVLVPANMYGPHDNFHLAEGHVIPALIHRTHLAKENSQDLEVWGSGKPLREFIYSRDVARIALLALNESLPEPLIISNGIETSIRELVNLIVDLMDFRGEVVWNESQPDGQYRKPSDTSKLDERFSELDFTPLPAGLADTVNWFLETYPRVRK